MSQVQVRRRPQQERSRTRVECILDVALEMIVEAGAENLAMREVARRAGVPIGSVYQYFPSKTAILRELAMRNMQHVSPLLREELAALMVETGGRPTPTEAVGRLIDVFYAHYRDHPGAAAVWAGAQPDPVLRELDVVDTRRTAEFLTPGIMLILSLDDRDSAFALALLLAEMTGSAARLALSVVSPLREQLIDKLKIMFAATLEAHLRKGSPP